MKERRRIRKAIRAVGLKPRGRTLSGLPWIEAMRRKQAVLRIEREDDGRGAEPIGRAIGRGR